MKVFALSLAAVPSSVRLIFTVMLMTVIVVLSLTPGESDAAASGFVWLVQTTPSLLQKFLHVGLYASLAASWLWALGPLTSARARLISAFGVAFVLGAVMEWLQVSIPGRFGTLYDVMLNGIGAILGVVVGHKLLRLDQ